MWVALKHFLIVCVKDVSVISADLVKPDDSIVAHTVIMGLDLIKHEIPKCCIPFRSYDV